MRKTVTSDDEAYNLYNDYAFNIGFSIRKGNIRTVGKTSVWRSRGYVCSCAGLKNDSKRHVRKFKKLDFRTNCGAFVEFIIDPEQLKVISVMKASGVRVTDSLSLLSKEVGGSPNLGCTRKDIYNALNTEKANRLDGSDCNQLIKYFAQRQAKEVDFYYEFEALDDDGYPLTYSHPTTKDSSLNVLPKQMNGQSSMGVQGASKKRKVPANDAQTSSRENTYNSQGNGRQPSKKNNNTSQPSSSSQFGY
uniref:FAR1 domain-containing protein n=1 Tax=Chenopodium quinoa TaxID=63459 RepID=A0A803MDK5_CHEQI